VQILLLWIEFDAAFWAAHQVRNRIPKVGANKSRGADQSHFALAP
jgi:hypothetical protein